VDDAEAFLFIAVVIATLCISNNKPEQVSTSSWVENTNMEAALVVVVVQFEAADYFVVPEE